MKGPLSKWKLSSFGRNVFPIRRHASGFYEGENNLSEKFKSVYDNSAYSRLVILRLCYVEGRESAEQVLQFIFSCSVGAPTRVSPPIFLEVITTNAWKVSVRISPLALCGTLWFSGIQLRLVQAFVFNMYRPIQPIPYNLSYINY